ncbi:MAG: acyl-ACP--UDP-N-acetylglucosamine O-acyltransferase [Clostridia bacterium]|nr:acyl-[acyl-carrier-protein]--UDP-N-acetylglucosamine O-acyltransferase [Bacillota bacterium]MBO2521857.1 acyl-[acyl-carrier-protein]--UDP-N-acetylglucosamine O-acyltransferase [Bacillota bacterium]
MEPKERTTERSKVIPMHTKIHPTAIVSPNAQLGVGVEVGPYAIIGDNVVIGDGTRIGPHAVIEGPTTIGKNNKIYAGAVIGNDPQDLKYKGERTYLTIGDNNIIREYATISRGTEHGGGETRIGNNNLIMSYVHVAHDVQMGNHIVIAHASGIGGHVVIEDRVNIGGLCGIHQFTKIGRMAMIGAHSMINKDVPPYVLVTGNPPKLYGVNIVGLRRNGLSPEVRMEIQRAYKILYRSGLNVSQAIERMERELPGIEEIDHFLRFLRSAERGICR